MKHHIHDTEFDFSPAANDYARYRVGFPDWFFDRILGLGIKFEGSRIADIGTGTGLLARAMAGRNAIVTGVDVSEGMVEEARKTPMRSGRPVNYVVAPAEATGLPSESFDIVTAATCWHLLDPVKTAAEAMRLLAPGGVLILCSLDWLPLVGNVVTATQSLVKKHNPEWSLHGGDGLRTAYVRDLREGGFRAVACFGVDYRVAFSHEAWRGRVRASVGIAATLSPKQVSMFDDELAAMLECDFPSDPVWVDHCIFAAIGWKGGGKDRPGSRAANR